MPDNYRPPESLYPFESHWLDLGGHRMHYLDEGPRDAPPVLMLHGNPTWSFYYRSLVISLRDRYRCIVPDHVGCGLSDKPDDANYRYTLEQRVADLARLLEYLTPGRAITLVVHDWGGMIGFAWAVRHAPDIARMIVLNTAAFPMPADKKLPFLLWLAGRSPVGPVLVRGLNAFAGLAARIAFKQPVAPEVRRAYTAPYDSWSNRIATLRFVQDIPLQPGDRGYEILEATEAGLSRLAGQPCLLAWGMRDFVFDEHFLTTWQRHFPAAETLRFEDCGHYVLEDAGDSLVASIADFIDRDEQRLAHA